MAKAIDDLGVNDLVTIEPTRDIFASTMIPKEVTDITIAKGYILTRGTLLGIVTGSGEYAPFNPDLSDGTEVLAGILGMDIDTTDDPKGAFMYVDGEFNASALKQYAGALYPVEDTDPITPGSYNYGNIVIVKEDK